MKSTMRIAHAPLPALGVAAALSTLVPESRERILDLARCGGASAILTGVATLAAWAWLTREAWRQTQGRPAHTHAALFVASLPWLCGCVALVGAALSPTAPLGDDGPLHAALLETFAPALFAHRMGACVSAGFLLAGFVARWRSAPTRDPLAVFAGASVAFFTFGIAWHEVEFALAHVRDKLAFAYLWAVGVALVAGAATAALVRVLRQRATAEAAKPARAQGPYREGRGTEEAPPSEDVPASLSLLATLACTSTAAWIGAAAALERAQLPWWFQAGRNRAFEDPTHWTIADVALARTFALVAMLCGALALVACAWSSVRRRVLLGAALLVTLAVPAIDGAAFVAVRSARAARLEGRLDATSVLTPGFLPINIYESWSPSVEAYRWVRLSGEVLHFDHGQVLSLRDDASLAAALSTALTRPPGGAESTLTLIPSANTSWSRFERVVRAAREAGADKVLVVGARDSLTLDPPMPDVAGAVVPMAWRLGAFELRLTFAPGATCPLACLVLASSLATSRLERDRIPSDRMAALPAVANVQELSTPYPSYGWGYGWVSIGCAPAAR